jgi:hypothetical protein
MVNVRGCTAKALAVLGRAFEPAAPPDVVEAIDMLVMSVSETRLATAECVVGSVATMSRRLNVPGPTTPVTCPVTGLLLVYSFRVDHTQDRPPRERINR